MDKKLENMSSIIVFDFLGGFFSEEDYENYMGFLYKEIDFTENEMRHIRDIYCTKGEDIVLKFIELVLSQKIKFFNKKQSNMNLYIDSILKIMYIKDAGFIYKSDKKYEFEQKFLNDIKKDFEKIGIDRIKMIVPVIDVMQKDKPISIINYSNGGETIEWLQSD